MGVGGDKNAKGMIMKTKDSDTGDNTNIKINSNTNTDTNIHINININPSNNTKSRAGGLLSKIHVEFHVSWHRFPNMASDWLAAVLPANWMPGLNILVK